MLHRHMKAVGADFLDLSSMATSVSGFYLPDNGHPSATGHAQIAQAVFRWIHERRSSPR